MNRALFLDRDGIINHDHGYVFQPEQFDFIDGIFTLCQHAQQQGLKIIVITNQSGIGRGMYSEQQFLDLTKWMMEAFNKKGIHITDVFFCPHHPTKAQGDYKVACQCRKPEPGMILEAAKKHHIDLKQSIFIGDKVSDLKAAQNAGVHNRILLQGHYGDDQAIEGHRIEKLLDSLQFIN
ncbi:D-glycero-beta-D-manno-heptose 1,7-bisphosphate 7-phosphatase [Thalassotalea aquiviva]|uniref:D-glycero-beta-D-manno-heptose 1,7-bisphosphate 7-phosphatase n=1 Tax=Thalassotalea aquiviva TaxID=3242415 RepID=UPI00352A234F